MIMENPHELVELPAYTLAECIAKETHNNRRYAWEEGHAAARAEQAEIVLKQQATIQTLREIIYIVDAAIAKAEAK